MASHTFTCNPSAFVSGSYSSISGQTNPIGKSQSSTSYATITCRTGRNAESYAFWSFDCSEIPDTATIDSVSCVAKCYVSSTSYVTTRGVQLYKGTTTAKGSSTTFSNSTSSTQTLSCGTWTRSELDTCYIRVYGKRGTSSTSSSATMRFYGATLTIVYTYEDVKYTVSLTMSGDGSVEPSGSTQVSQGEPFEFVVTMDNADGGLVVTDNGIDITDNHTHNTRTVIDIPSISLEDSDFTITQRGTASYGFTKQSSALTYTSTMSGSSTRAGCTRFSTNLSSPMDVTLKIKWNSQNTSDYVYVGNFDTSLSTSTTKPSNGTYQYSHSGTTTEQTYTMTIPSGSHYFDIYNYHYKSNSSRACTVVFSGESDEVSHEEEIENEIVFIIENVSKDHVIVVTIGGASTKLFVKVGGAWVEARKVYKKTGGVWVEQTDLTNLFDNPPYIPMP